MSSPLCPRTLQCSLARQLLSALLIVSCTLSGCDDGKIYPTEPEEQERIAITLSVSFQEIEIWPQAYTLVFGAFEEGETSPYLSKRLVAPTESDEWIDLELTGLRPSTHHVSIAVVNRGREVQYEYFRYALEGEVESVDLEPVQLSLVQFKRIQQQIFSSYCSRCHGEGNSAAAGLFLSAGKSHESLVGRSSSLREEILVKPYQPNQSFLLQVLTEDLINYNHTDVLPEAELIELIRAWIDVGAPVAPED